MGAQAAAPAWCLAVLQPGRAPNPLNPARDGRWALPHKSPKAVRDSALSHQISTRFEAAHPLPAASNRRRPFVTSCVASRPAAGWRRTPGRRESFVIFVRNPRVCVGQKNWLKNLIASRSLEFCQFCHFCLFKVLKSFLSLFESSLIPPRICIYGLRAKADKTDKTKNLFPSWHYSAFVLSQHPLSDFRQNDKTPLSSIPLEEQLSHLAFKR